MPNLRRRVGLMLAAISMLLSSMTGAALADPGGGKPTIYGHRGAAGYRPEHTLASYRVGARLGADYIEPDLVSTKDHVLVVRHEPAIGATTDVADHPEFADRRTTKVIDGVPFPDDWFVEDFTLAELKTLRAKERLPDVRQRNTIYDGRYEVPTFQEVIDLRSQLSHQLHRRIGLIPELKHSTYFRSIGLPLEEPFVDTLRANHIANRRGKVTVQSFEIGNLKVLNDELPRVPLVQLLDSPELKPGDVLAAGGTTTYGQMATPEGLAEIAKYADIVGPSKTYIVPRDDDGPFAHADVVRGRRARRGARRRALHVPQREPVPAGGAAVERRSQRVRQRDRRVPAVLRPRGRRPVLRQPRHRQGRPRRRVTNRRRAAAPPSGAAARCGPQLPARAASELRGTNGVGGTAAGSTGRRPIPA